MSVLTGASRGRRALQWPGLGGGRGTGRPWAAAVAVAWKPWMARWDFG
jgi:hypothetical protein